MPFHSVVPKEKPLQHISLADWNARVGRLRNMADARRADAFAIRQSSRALRDETRIESNWAAIETNDALTDRIDEINYWKKIIERTLERIDSEIRVLQEEIKKTERELDDLAGPIALISEVLTMRDSRLGAEMTYDEPDKEIKTELMVLENNQLLLTERCHKAWEKLMRLEDVRFKMIMEIENKKEAVDMDTKQLALDRYSSSITYKPDPLRNPKKTCSYEAWLLNVKNIKQIAENELADTAAIRESLCVCRDKASNVLKSQQEHTEFTLRKRIFETQRARNELDYQRQKMKEEMEKAACDIESLNGALEDKSNILKLAETRLENRALRRGNELCLDYPQNMLFEEVEKLREMRRCLQAKIEESQQSFNLLADQMQKIVIDLENKEHSLMTDTRALDMRQLLRDKGIKVYNPSAQTDRNIEITGMEKVIPKD